MNVLTDFNIEFKTLVNFNNRFLKTFKIIYPLVINFSKYLMINHVKFFWLSLFNSKWHMIF